MGVVTLNLPQIAIESNGDYDKFWSLLDERLLVVRDALMIKYNRFTEATSDVSPIHY